MSSNEKRLYNSILSKMYILYLEKHYPEVNVHDILKDAGLDEASINDPSHWFTQKEVNRFHDAIIEYSEGKNIPYYTGKFGFEESMKDSEETIKKRAQALGNPIEVFNELLPLAGVLTKSCSYQTHIESDSTIKVIVTENDNVAEEPFQCESRKGYFTGLVKMFDDYLEPEFKHEKCMFNGQQKGGNRVCEYIITLKRKYTSGKNKAEEIERVKDELSKTRKELSRAYTDLLKMEKENHTYAILMNEMGNVFQEKITMNDIIGKTLQTLGKRLNFNLGIVFLADHDESNLLYRGHFGSDDAKDIEFLKKEGIFPLKDKKLGPFAKCFNTKEIRIVPNTDKIKNEITAAKNKIIIRFSIKSFICAPVIHKGKCLGVFAVSNKKNDKCFTKKDEIFVSGIASDLGVVIHNYLKYLEETYLKIKTKENEKKIIIRQDLAGRAIHNIRNPAQAMHTCLDTIKKKDNPSPELSNRLNRLELNLVRIEELANDFLRYLRPIKIRKERINLHELITMIVFRMDGDNAIEIDTNFDKSSIIVADKSSMTYIFEEMIHNAKKNGATQISLRGKPQDNIKTITIEDNGRGIPDKFEDNIFEPFKSVDPINTGLGMPIIKNMVKEHKGKIYYDNEYKQGARFIVELPIK